MAQRSSPAPFLTKTYQLVEDESSDDVISWSESGTTFVVWKTADFANDLLPKSFKHNNFSSFVRQLNTYVSSSSFFCLPLSLATAASDPDHESPPVNDKLQEDIVSSPGDGDGNYGFRKTVPDKWEFANDNFKQGQKELLIKIRRRKTATSTATQGKTAGKSAGVDQMSPSDSGEEGGSTSTSSPDSKNPGSVETVQVTQVAELSEENQKLKKDNQILNCELAETKKQCDDLVGFLTKYLKVGPDQIDLIMRQGSHASTQDGSTGAIGVEDDKGGKATAEEEGESLKLFGVWLVEKNAKRLRDDKQELKQPHPKSLKSVELRAPLGRGSNICT